MNAEGGGKNEQLLEWSGEGICFVLIKVVAVAEEQKGSGVMSLGQPIGAFSSPMVAVSPRIETSLHLATRVGGGSCRTSSQRSRGYSQNGIDDPSLASPPR